MAHCAQKLNHLLSKNSAGGPKVAGWRPCWRAGGAHAWVVGGAHAPRCWRWKVPQNFCGENLEVSNQAQKLQSRSAENGGAWFWGRPAGSIKPPGIAGTRTDPKSLHPPLLLLHPPGGTCQCHCQWQWQCQLGYPRWGGENDFC